MAREHRKDKAHHRSHHRSPEHHTSRRSHKSHKSHRPPKHHRTHASKREVSESSSPQSREQVIGLSTSSQRALFAAFAKDNCRSQKKHATKSRPVKYSPEPELVKTRRAQNPPPPPPKVRRTVSIAGVFKRQDHQPAKRKIRHKIPDPPLAIKIQNEMEGAFATLRAESKSSFDSIYTQFCERIQNTREKDEELIQYVSKAVKKLSAPLVEEDIEIRTVENGKRVKKSVTIGDRANSFKAFIEKETANLEDLWGQWDEVRGEYMDLDRKIFGIAALADNPDDEIGPDQGYKQDTEEQNLQHTMSLEQLSKEIGELRPNIMKKMKALEKELDMEAKKDQEAFLRTLLFI